MIRWLTATLLLGAIACGCVDPLLPVPYSSAIEIPDSDLRVLFVGNSLTSSNDLPGVVGALATAGDRSFSHATVAVGGWSLEEHWSAGLPDVIRDVAPDVVVLQQGPSSLPQNQAHLAHWTDRLATVIREEGGEPALLMVWPDHTRAEFFPAVRQAYSAAAAGVGGLFIPGGQSWVEAWAIDPDLGFWSSDGLHPSYLGTLAAAMATYAVLFDADPATIPDLEGDSVSPEIVALLRSAVATATQ